MTKDEQLEKVKEALSITGNFQDKALMIYLENHARGGRDHA